MEIERHILLERNIPTKKIRKALAPRSNVDTWRVYYCYQMGAAFLGVGMLETTLINAMAMCDRIKIAQVLQDDAPAFLHIAERHTNLRSSTLGNLVSLLSKHGILDADLAYLKWIKKKRDYFVHQFCNDEKWPGDLSESGLRMLCRRLTYLEYIFLRASGRIYRILDRAGLMRIHDLGEDGFIAVNIDSEFF
jgi:hypothetical protein